MSAVAEVQNQVSTTRLLWGIPIRNLWLLMFYASGLYRHIGTGSGFAKINQCNYNECAISVFFKHRMTEKCLFQKT